MGIEGANLAGEGVAGKVSALNGPKKGPPEGPPPPSLLKPSSASALDGTAKGPPAGPPPAGRTSSLKKASPAADGSFADPPSSSSSSLVPGAVPIASSSHSPPPSPFNAKEVAMSEEEMSSLATNGASQPKRMSSRFGTMSKLWFGSLSSALPTPAGPVGQSGNAAGPAGQNGNEPSPQPTGQTGQQTSTDPDSSSSSSQAKIVEQDGGDLTAPNSVASTPVTSPAAQHSTSKTPAGAATPAPAESAVKLKLASAKPVAPGVVMSASGNLHAEQLKLVIYVADHPQVGPARFAVSYDASVQHATTRAISLLDAQLKAKHIGPHFLLRASPEGANLPLHSMAKDVFKSHDSSASRWMDGEPAKKAAAYSQSSTTPTKKAVPELVGYLVEVTLETKQKQQQVDAANKVQRLTVFSEIVQTEESYVEGLVALVAGYQGPLVSNGLLRKEEAEQIFGNAEELVEFHQELYMQLKNTLDRWDHHTCVAPIFLQISPALDFYTSYIANYHHALESLKKLREKNRRLDKWLGDQQKTLERSHSGSRELSALLITPIQRLPRYSLLLKELLKCTIPEHMDFRGLKGALDDIGECTTQLNERKYAMDNRARMKEIAAQVPDYEGLLDNPERRLLFEATVTFYGVDVLGGGPTEDGEVSASNHNDLPTDAESTVTPAAAATSSSPVSPAASNGSDSAQPTSVSPTTVTAATAELSAKQKKGKACILFALSDMLLVVRVKKKKIGSGVFWRFFREFEMVDTAASLGPSEPRAASLAKRIGLEDVSKLLVLTVDEEQLFFLGNATHQAEKWAVEINAASKELQQIRAKAHAAEKEAKERPEMERKAKEQKLLELEDKVTHLNEQLSQSKQEKDKLQTSLAALEAAQAETKTRLENKLVALQTQLEDKEAANRRLVSELQSAQSDSKRLADSLSSQRRREDEGKTQVDAERLARQSQLSDLRAELSAAKQAAAAAEAKMAEVSLRCTKLEADLSQRLAQLAEAKKNTREKEDTVSSLQQTLEQLAKQSAEARSSLAAKTSEGDQDKAKLQDLASKLEEEKTAHEDTARRAKQHAEAQEHAIAALKEESVVLASRLQAKERQEQQKQAELAVAARQQSEKDSELSGLQEKLNEMEQQLGKTQEEASATASALSLRTEQFQEAKNKIATLTAQNTDLNRQLEQARALEQELSVKQSAHQSEGASQIAALEASLASLTAQLEEKTAEAGKTAQRLLELANSLVEKDQALAALQGTVEAANQQLSAEQARYAAELTAMQQAKQGFEQEAALELQRVHREFAREKERANEETQRLDAALAASAAQEAAERQAREDALSQARQTALLVITLQDELAAVRSSVSQALAREQTLEAKNNLLENKLNELLKDKQSLQARLAVAQQSLDTVREHAQDNVSDFASAASGTAAPPSPSSKPRRSASSGFFAGNNNGSRPPTPDQNLIKRKNERQPRGSGSGKPPKCAGTLIQRVEATGLAKGQSGLKVTWKRVHVELTSANVLRVYHGKEGVTSLQLQKEGVTSLQLQKGQYSCLRLMDKHYDKTNCFELRPTDQVNTPKNSNNNNNNNNSGKVAWGDNEADDPAGPEDKKGLVLMAMTGSKLNEWLQQLGKVLGGVKMEKRHTQGFVVHRYEEQVEVKDDVEGVTDGAKLQTTWVKWKRYWGTLDTGRLCLSIRDEETGELKLQSDIRFKFTAGLIVKAVPVAKFSKPFCIQATSSAGDSVVLMLLNEKDQKAWLGAFHALIADARRR
eukprot:g14008.t1